MDRVRLVLAIVFAVAIPLGGIGAGAFNPDSGWLAHNALLYHIFGGTFEIGLFVVAAAVVLALIIGAMMWLSRNDSSEQ